MQAVENIVTRVFFCSVVIETIVIIVVGEHTVTAQTNACYERLCQHTVPPGYHWYSARFCNVTIMVTGRMPRSGKLPVLDLLTGRKSGFSPTGATRCTHCRSSFTGPTATWVRFAVHNFTSIAAHGWECVPENLRNCHRLVHTRPTGATSLTDVENFYGFYTPDYPTLVHSSNRQ